MTAAPHTDPALLAERFGSLLEVCTEQAQPSSPVSFPRSHGDVLRDRRATLLGDDEPATDHPSPEAGR